jgi:tRNA nucleotidyltransferase (CCA-adding enzyme)
MDRIDSQREHLAKRIAQVVDLHGGQAYFVGGCVRDELLGRIPKDIDIEVFGIEAGDLKRIMEEDVGDVALCGESFGILKVTSGVTIDVGMPRKDKCVGKSHRSFMVGTDPDMSTEEASNRRDITYNALMKRVTTGELFDFHGGVSDLSAGIVRAVDEKRFLEDPLRMLRAVKFASRYEHIIEENTLRLIKNHVSQIENLPKERIFTEISDILMEGKTSSYGFHLMNMTGLLDILLPEISVLQCVDQNPQWHPEGNAYIHTMNCVEHYKPEDRDLITQLALLFHDTGKVYGTINHEARSVEIVNDAFPKRLTSEKEVIDRVSNLVGHHMQMYGGNVTRARVKRLASKSSMEDLIKIFRADKLSRTPDVSVYEECETHIQEFLTVYDEIQNEVEPIIRGRDIQAFYSSVIQEGPMYSIVLNKVYQLQLDDVFSDYEGGLKCLDDVVREVVDVPDEVIA